MTDAPPGAGRRWTVDLSVNAYPGDLPFLEATLRHLRRSLRSVPIGTAWLIVDLDEATGRFAGGGRPGGDELLAVTERLRRDGVIDRCEPVPADPALRADIQQRWFGDAASPERAFDGSLRLHYSYGIEVSDADYLVHLDADMLLHSPDGGGWVLAAIAAMERIDDFVLGQPMGGPPKAAGAWQLAVGRIADRATHDFTWHRGGGCSTRVFVTDRRRFRDRLLPLEATRPDEMWERAVGHTMAVRGLHRYTLDDPGTYSLHPVDHGAQYLAHLDDLIWAVEHDVYPFRRNGHAWDVRTDGRNFLPWRWRIRAARRRGGAGR